MRVFLAVELPAALRLAIGERLDTLRARLPAASWTPADNLHLTLHFFGERQPARVEQIAGALVPAIASCSPFTVETAPVGSFPTSRPRVLWLGITPNPRLLALHADVLRELAQLGEELDPRPFHPHLTLARVKAPWRRSDLDTLRDGLRELEGECVAVESVTMFESHLGGKGARHEARHVLALQGGERLPS